MQVNKSKPHALVAWRDARRRNRTSMSAEKAIEQLVSELKRNPMPPEVIEEQVALFAKVANLRLRFLTVPRFDKVRQRSFMKCAGFSHFPLLHPFM